MNTPDSILPHQPDYQQAAWQQYTIDELGHWVHLLAKRALHRAHQAKRVKDLYDARNYLAMIVAHLDAIEASTCEKRPE